MYNSASNRHHQLTDSKVDESEDEWRSLIEEFEAIVAADPDGEWADDAQYAIGSCWIWLSKDTDTEPILNAIGALEKLLKNYPDSPLVADAHYWLGDCCVQIGADDLAAIHYQKVINAYFNHPMSELAQFNLAQIYEKQNNLAVAISMFESLAERSRDLQLGARAEERIKYLQSGIASFDGSGIKTTGTSSPRLDMSSERRSLGPPPTEESLAKPVKTSATSPETDSKEDGHVGQSVPQMVLTEESESTSLPSVKINPRTSLPKSEKRTAQPQKHEGPRLPKTLHTANSVAKPGINLSLPRQLGLGVKTVVIDPGHGGKDPGAISSRSIQEKSVVLELSIMLRDLLVSRGYNVRLTRESDIYLPLQERTRMATVQGADLFISVHANAAAHTGASGVETYYLALASDETAKRTAARENSGAGYGIKELDKLVARILRESKSVESRRLAQCVQAELVNSTKAIDRGVKHAPFVVLIGTKVPAVLVEIGFLSHLAEAKKLTKKAYQRNIAEALARGIDQYVSSSPVTTVKIEGGVNE